LTCISEDPDVRFRSRQEGSSTSPQISAFPGARLFRWLIAGEPIGHLDGDGQGIKSLRCAFVCARKLGVTPPAVASNISFGLPNRHGINNAFLPMRWGAGMTSAMALNPITLQ